MNSICALFLAWGLLGFVGTPSIQPKLARKAVMMPVLIAPPLETRESETRVSGVAAILHKESELETFSPAPVEVPAPVRMVEAPAAIVVAPVGRVTLAEEFAPREVLPTSQADDPPMERFVPSEAIREGSFPAPQYPEAARRNRLEGTVEIRITVGADGRVVEAGIERSSGHVILDREALETVRTRWRFPAGERRLVIWPCVFKLEQKR